MTRKPASPSPFAAVIGQLEGAAVQLGRCTLALNADRVLDARAHVANALRALHVVIDDLRHERWHDD